MKLMSFVLTIVIFVFNANAQNQTHSQRAIPPIEDFEASKLSGHEKAKALEYLMANDKGLQKMRGATGWPVDKVNCKNDTGKEECAFQDTSTSPTNMALDILYNLEILQNFSKEFGDVSQRRQTLENAIKSLEKAEFHKDTGLFFSWYDVHNGSVVGKGVPAIDNFHLALALWTTSQRLPEGDPLKLRAKALFDRMDFSAFWDPEKKLLGGNIRYIKEENRWELEAYRMLHFGSETRSLYFTGSAMGLFKKFGKLPVPELLKNKHFETADTRQGKVLRTWDGSSFQVFLPQLLLNESAYSGEMNKMFSAQTARMLERGEKLIGGMPAAFSASEAIDPDNPSTTLYSGKFGDAETVALDNKEFEQPKHRKHWESVATVHAAVLGTEFEPKQMLERLQKVEKLGSEHNMPLYNKDRGWLDGVMVSGKSKGKSVPTQLSLDQLMMQLAFLKTLSPDGESASSRALKNVETIKSDLAVTYSRIDSKFDSGMTRKE